MSEITLIGNGFVGKNLADLYQDEIATIYDSKSIDTISNKKHHTLFCAAPGGKKWLANQYPQRDLEDCKRLISNILATRAERVVLFSTVDVYSLEQIVKSEEDVGRNEEPYGQHRRFIESALQEHATSCHVIRLPALFGRHLQKNYVFDLLNDNNLSAIKLRSSFQWLYMKRIRFFVDLVLQQQIKTLNLTTQPLGTTELVTRFFLDKQPFLNGKEEGQHYCIKSKYFEEFALSKNDVLCDLEEYISENRNNNVGDESNI